MLRINQGHRVVVTGLGVVSPIGSTHQRFWDALNSSDEQNATGQAADFSGHISEFATPSADSKKALRKALKLMNRETLMGVSAGLEAWADSRLGDSELDPGRLGVCFGAGNVGIMPQDFQPAVAACSNAEEQFEFERWGGDGIGEIAPLWLLKCLPNMPSCYLAIVQQLLGPNNTITQREAAANMAVAEAAAWILQGDADAVLVGGTGDTLASMNRVHAQLEQEIAVGSASQPVVCRPFDHRRNGSPPAEGAAALVLERADSALQRGATIYGEIRGVGVSCVAESTVGPHTVGRCDVSAANAIRLAVKRAGLDPQHVGHVHAHGLATIQSDAAEARAISSVFGAAPRRRVPVVAAKSHTGNASAGSGAMELVASLLAQHHGRLFPTRNADQPDPECRLEVVQDRGVAAGDSFVSLSMLRRGLASCVAVSRFDG